MIKVKLFNIGKRSFILEEGRLDPLQEIEVAKETADKLLNNYKGELRITGSEPVVSEVKTSKKKSK